MVDFADFTVAAEGRVDYCKHEFGEFVADLGELFSDSFELGDTRMGSGVQP